MIKNFVGYYSMLFINHGIVQGDLSSTRRRPSIGGLPSFLTIFTTALQYTLYVPETQKNPTLMPLERSQQ